MILGAIPQSLFQPLAAPGAPIYARILLDLFIQTQSHPDPLSRFRPGVLDSAAQLEAADILDPATLRLRQNSEASTAVFKLLATTAPARFGPTWS